MHSNPQEFRKKTHQNFLLALVNIAAGIAGFFIPLPDFAKDYATLNTIGNIALIVVGGGMAIFYRMRLIRIEGEIALASRPCCFPVFLARMNCRNFLPHRSSRGSAGKLRP